MNYEGLVGQGLAPAYQSEYPLDKMAHQPTLKQRLDLAVKQAEERLVAAKRAREIFDAHPELEELLNIMQRGHF
jgi:hypothetical protein